MKIVLTGGGSGGHITPVLAVASEIKRLNNTTKIVFIGQPNDQLAKIAKDNSSVDEYYSVRAGKFRRYHGEGISQFLDFKTALLNLRDAFYLIIGVFQSYRLLKRIKPEIIFTRGSYVSVPVCLAARMMKIPYITHDSDSIPSLTNRIIGKTARYNMTALPSENYKYPPEKSIFTGIPLNKNFVQVDSKLKAHYRNELKLPTKAKIILITGGGQGAEQLNMAFSEIAGHLLEQHKDLYIINIAGLSNEARVRERYDNELSKDIQNRLIIIGFADELYKYSGASDIIVTRAGATNLAEFAVQNKAVVIIPGTHLTSGHQLENAKALVREHAAILLDSDDLDEDSNRLAKILNDLFSNPSKIKDLEKSIAKLAKPGASKMIAKILLEDNRDAT